MALPQDAMDTIRRIQNKGVSTPQERTSLIEETKETFKKSADPLLRMFPIPAVKDTLLYYKVDLFVIPDVDDDKHESAFIKVNLRTEASVTYNYEEEESTSDGTRGFSQYKSSIRTNNEHNRPSNVIDKQLIPHPFYQEVIATRKEIMQKYKKHDMLIKPYLSNFYKPGSKNEGQIILTYINYIGLNALQIFLAEETTCSIIKKEIGIVLKVYSKLWKNI